MVGIVEGKIAGKGKAEKRNLAERLASLYESVKEDKNLKPEDDYLEQYSKILKEFDEAIYFDRPIEAERFFKLLQENLAYLEELAKDPIAVRRNFFDKLIPEMERIGELETAKRMRESLNVENSCRDLEIFIEKAKLYYVFINSGNPEIYFRNMENKFLKDPDIIEYIENLFPGKLEAELTRREEN